MANLPENWGLTTQKNDKGTLDVLGKTDAGETYRVRTTDGPEITDTDITELRAADRESYNTSDTSEAAWTAVHNLIDDAKARKASQESSYQDELVTAAEEWVGNTKVRRGFASRSDTIEVPEVIGYAHIPQWRWDLAFKGDN